MVAGDGRSKVCAEISGEEARKISCEEGFDANRWLNEEGYEVETLSPERLWAQRMATFERSLEEQDWRSILRAAN